MKQTNQTSQLNMRLLVITNIYPPQNLGGFGLCIQRLTEALQKKGYSTLVLTGDQRQLGEVEEEEQIERTLHLLGDYKEGIQHLEDGIERRRRKEANLIRVEEAFKRYKPDACLAGNLDLLGKEVLDKVLSYNIPTVQHIGFMGSPFSGDWLPKEKPFKLAFASGEVKRLLKGMGHKVDSHPIIYPPLQSDKAPTIETKKISKIFTIGFCGLIMQSKGLHVAIEAAAQLKAQRIPFKFTIAGEVFSQEYKKALKAYCEKNGLSKDIKWNGFIKPENLSTFYEELDVLVFPSLYPESFGMVVAEAMTHAVVPITSGVGGAFEVITHKIDGLLVEPGNSKDLYEKLLWCARNRGHVKTIGTNARKYSILRFAPDKSAETLHNTFKEIERKKDKKIKVFS